MMTSVLFLTTSLFNNKLFCLTFKYLLCLKATVFCDVMCDVIWFRPKAFPSLHYFVIIVAQFTTTHPNDPKRGKQPPKPKKGERPQKKLWEILGAIIEFVL